MKIILIFLLFVPITWGCTCAALASPADHIVGTWKFTFYRYQGQERPIPNPDLDLRFTFISRGYSILKWSRTNEPGFCQRLAEFRIDPDHLLFQKTIWLDPKNDLTCGTDPEMRIGSESFTNFSFENDQLLLNLQLGGELFVYVMIRVP